MPNIFSTKENTSYGFVMTLDINQWLKHFCFHIPLIFQLLHTKISYYIMNHYYHLFTQFGISSPLKAVHFPQTVVPRSSMWTIRHTTTFAFIASRQRLKAHISQSHDMLRVTGGRHGLAEVPLCTPGPNPKCHVTNPHIQRNTWLYMSVCFFLIALASKSLEAWLSSGTRLLLSFTDRLGVRHRIRRTGTCRSSG